MGKQVSFTAPQVKAFLYSLKRGIINDENNRRGIINIFLRAIYLFDDRLTLILNGGDRQITIDNILIDEIEEHFADAVSYHARCSPLVAAAPPKKHRNFDTMGIKVAVLSFCPKALISRGFWLLSAPAVARQSESLPPAQYAKALGSSRLSFGLWVRRILIEL